MAWLDPKTVSMFYFTGDKHTTPNCPVMLQPDFNPTSAAQSYLNADTKCTYNAKYYIPFFLKDMGPKFSEYSVNAHEARPGHHTQVRYDLQFHLLTLLGSSKHDYSLSVIHGCPFSPIS